uniref:Conserved hypothetical plastid protein n=1 Tax=Bulboplastis apyrenoidosa TaxID=1070855 RepID=A0A1Y9TM68_9RHOD|nr:conserved hypothetical plastid protein [Bulboplastis apyrenoidosa]ARO90730.1 conserved hypothetical plastid protein [Bulboplastis apyrenoidosa]
MSLYFYIYCIKLIIIYILFTFILMPLFQNTQLYNHIFFKKAYPEIFEPGTGKFFKDISFLWFEQKIIIRQVKEKYSLYNLYYFHQQKYQLKQALRSGRIELFVPSLKNGNNFCKIDKNGIQYKWRKGINLSPANHWPSIFINRRTPGFPSKKQRNIINHLQNFPVFIVRNGFKEIPIGVVTSRSEKNIGDILYNLYRDYCIWTRDNDIYSIGLFFINPQDALEFQNTIQYKYPRSTNELNLSTVAIKLNAAYMLNRTSPPHIQFRFIPNFQEISKLLTTYKYQKSVKFHPKQIYGNTYFQGQPIYIVETKDSEKDQSKSYIFTSKEVLDTEWNYIEKQNNSKNYLKNTTIIIYNLEDFLCDLEDKDDLSFHFFTNNDAYKFINQYSISNQSGFLPSIYESIQQSILFTNVWAKRIFWALTHFELIST